MNLILLVLKTIERQLDGFLLLPTGLQCHPIPTQVNERFVCKNS
jgi:hypothetical protein